MTAAQATPRSKRETTKRAESRSDTTHVAASSAPAPTPAAAPDDAGSPTSTLPAQSPEAAPQDNVPASTAVVLDGGISVEVSSDQRATISGDSPSLRAVIEEVCRQAGIQLRTYSAPDRRYVAHLDRVPVADALRSMLRTESYLVGVRADSNSRRGRVTWLRVLGPEGGATSSARPGMSAPAAGSAPAPAAAAPPSQFVLSSSLLFQAFGTFDPQRREQAQQEILTRIMDPNQLGHFLSADPKELAKMFGRYRDAATTIRRMQGLAERPELQAKFDEILAAIGEK